MSATPALAVFDLIGTTARDDGAIASALGDVLASHGVAATPAAIAAVRGLSKRDAILQLMPDGAARTERAAGAYDAFVRRVARVFREDGLQPVDGALDVFAVLRARGIAVAITTGLDRDVARLAIRALCWHGLADAIVCGDDVSRGRPAPYMIFRAMEATATLCVRQVMTIGDTVSDLRAGHHAGTGWNIGVLTGGQALADLAAAPHTDLLGSIADLPGLLGLT